MRYVQKFLAKRHLWQWFVQKTGQYVQRYRVKCPKKSGKSISWPTEMSKDTWWKAGESPFCPVFLDILAPISPVLMQTAILYLVLLDIFWLRGRAGLSSHPIFLDIFPPRCLVPKEQMTRVRLGEWGKCSLITRLQKFDGTVYDHFFRFKAAYNHQFLVNRTTQIWSNDHSFRRVWRAVRRIS